MCGFLYDRPLRKTRWFMDLATLSQMLSYLNVHAGSRGLILDDAYGLVSLAILERLGGLGALFSLTERGTSAFDAIENCTLPSQHLECLRTLPLHLLKQEIRIPTPHHLAGEDEKFLQRKHSFEKYLGVQQELLRGGLDL